MAAGLLALKAAPAPPPAAAAAAPQAGRTTPCSSARPPRIGQLNQTWACATASNGRATARICHCPMLARGGFAYICGLASGSRVASGEVGDSLENNLEADSESRAMRS